MPAFRSFAAQTRHYFARPQQGQPAGPIAGPAIWRGVELRENPQQWRFELTAEHCAELISAITGVRARQLPMSEVARSDFALPQLASEIQNWRQRIEYGPGFVVVTRLPVEQLSEEDLALAFWGIGHHLGTPGAQNPDQELLGHVRDYHEADSTVRLYRTASNINFHCDAADVVGLLCLQKARTGGQSRIVSSGFLYNECLARAPGAAAQLFTAFKLDGRGESRNGRGYSEIVPCCFADGQLRTFFHSEYFRSVERLDGVTLDEAQRQLLDVYDSVAADPTNYLDMDLRPGDMQFLSNHTIVHARTAYQDDPENPRHLLRLWLSLSED